MYNLKLRVTFKKLNIITGREKSIQDTLESMHVGQFSVIQ